MDVAFKTKVFIEDVEHLVDVEAEVTGFYEDNVKVKILDVYSITTSESIDWQNVFTLRQKSMLEDLAIDETPYLEV